MLLSSQQKVCLSKVDKPPPSQLLLNMKHIKGLKELIDICFLSKWSCVGDQLMLSLSCKSRNIFNFSNSSKVPGSLTMPSWLRSTIDELKVAAQAVHNNIMSILTLMQGHMHACMDIFWKALFECSSEFSVTRTPTHIIMLCFNLLLNNTHVKAMSQPQCLVTFYRTTKTKDQTRALANGMNIVYNNVIKHRLK